MSARVFHDEQAGVEIACYLYPDWAPRIRPASRRRAWMDATPESFAYRCLPLTIANAHGWEVLSPCAFEAEWDGRQGVEAVRITFDGGVVPKDRPVSLFGQGTLTFHVPGLFRTPPGWNLWIGGPPNEARDGIAPLGGIVETDWAPYSFTMNWQFTRPRHRIRFEENEPFALFFPVQRGLLEEAEPVFRPIDAAPELKDQFEAWSRSRDAFQAAVAADPPARPGDKWQKLYYRGIDMTGQCPVPDHQSKVSPPDFANAPSAPPDRRLVPAIATATPDRSIAKRDWLAETRQRLRALSPRTSAIPAIEAIDADEFLDRHYALNWPALLPGAAADWPAVHRWSPPYLRQMVGDAEVEFQSDRAGDDRYELEKGAHRRTLPFSRFLDAVEAAGCSNDLYLTAYNQGANATALAPLRADIGEIDHVLAPGGAREGMMWIGPEGTFTPLHHDLTNNLFVQITGTKEVILVSPEETGKVANEHHVYSALYDVSPGVVDTAKYPQSQSLRTSRIVLGPGDALFIPIGWWHQVRSLSFSISLTSTSFLWPNDFYQDFPSS